MDQLSPVGKGGFPPMTVGSGRTAVKLELECQGMDLILRVSGGKAHVGAVAVWDGRRPADPPILTELPCHKEGPLAAACAEMVGRATGRTTVAVVGIHQDEATRAEIEAIVTHAKQAAQKAAEEFLKGNGPGNAE